MKRHMRRFAWVLSILLAVAVVGQEPSNGPAIAPETDESKPTIENEDAVLRSLALLGEVLARIKQNHYDRPTVEQLTEGAIRGMLRTLDPYSQYYDAEAYQELQTDTQGKFGGLGMYIGLKQDQLTVISPIEDTPAYRAGIQAGDRIVEIDGESTAGMSADDAARKMRGEPGTDVTLTIVREGVDEPIVLTITRDVITVVSVKYRRLSENIGYIRITGFMKPTAEAVGEAIRELTAQGVGGFILDLRSNPGGLLGAAVDVASYFLKEGDLVVYTQGGGEREEYRAVAKEDRTDLPLVVLVNRGSASASEIVAGALKAHRRALLVGSRTFGKASVQKIFPLREGNGMSAIKLTVYHYYTPDGIDIHKVGIDPHVELPVHSPLERRMWSRVRSSEALREFLADEGSDVLERLKEALRSEDTTQPLRRKYRRFIDALDKENIVIGDALLKYAIALETLDETDDYEYDPQIREAIRYLRAFETFRTLRGSSENAAETEAPSE